MNKVLKGTNKLILVASVVASVTGTADAAAAKPVAVRIPAMSGFVMDKQGAVLVADAASNSVYRIENGGDPELLVGRAKGLYRPNGLGFDGDKLFVSDERGVFQVISTAATRSARAQLTLQQVQSFVEPGPQLPFVKITAPALLTRCTINKRVQIRWAHNLAATTRFRVELSRDLGETWETLADDVKGTSFDWTVTAPQTEMARLRVSEVEALTPATRESVFDITDDIVYVLNPVE